MGKKLSPVAERLCHESTITVITTDRYFFMAIKHIIHSMLPEILSEKGVLYNVVHCESVFHMNFQDMIQNEDRLLIADYDVRLIGNSQVLNLIQGMKIFGSMMLVIHKELPIAEVDCCLAKGAPVAEIKKICETLFCKNARHKISTSPAISYCRVSPDASIRSFV